MTAAKKCKSMGWKPGTVVVGRIYDDEFAEMRITAIGESAVLTRRKGAMEFAHHHLDAFVEKAKATKGAANG